jgi:ubiquinone/menaquinone biosynthesis C-methylase UbiE
MNFTVGLNSINDNINDINDIKNDNKYNIEEYLTPEYFISTILCLKSLKEFYNINFISLNDINLSFTLNKKNPPKFILLSKGILQVQSDLSPLIICSSKVNSIYRMDHFYSYDGLPSIFIYLLNLLYNKYKDNKRYYSSFIKPFFDSFGESISFLIKENKLEYLNVDTLPSFEELCEQSYSIFSKFITIINPPIKPYGLLNNNLDNQSDTKTDTKSKTNSNILLGKKESNQYDKKLEDYINTVSPSINYNIEKLKGKYNIYMFPSIKSTIDIIYPNIEMESKIKEMSKEMKSIFNYWLMGGKVNIYYSFIQRLKKFENQYLIHSLFEQSNFQKLFNYPQTWSLSQVKSIQDKNVLEYVVGKFLFGKQRNIVENKILKSLIKDYSDQDDLTFYNECQRYYKHSEFDRSIARVKELDKLNIWSLIKTENIKDIKYLDFGGGDGQNAFAIANKLKCKKGDVFVSDIQSWFGNENVQKYKDLLTYRYLKTFYLPFEDNTFNFITMFQVLHHIREYNYTVKELYRILKDDGILLIREHDCINDTVATLIDIEHSLFEISGKVNVDYSYLQEYYAHYFSKKELYDLLHSVGFVQVQKSKGVPLETEPVGETRYYLTVFKKVNNNNNNTDIDINTVLEQIDD